tara:strand:- start:326 stop:808 length:483 start_codon:yes stop_codon:yes gene_type:complete
MKLITDFIFSDDGRIACDKCGQFTWQRDLSMIGKDFVCQSCANDMHVDEDLEVLMDDFEEWGTGGGCTARVKYLQIENELHTLIITNAHGDSKPSLKHGISYALYKGDWGSDVHPAHCGPIDEEGYKPKFSGAWTGNYFCPSDDLNEGLDEIKQIMKMGE